MINNQGEPKPGINEKGNTKFDHFKLSKAGTNIQSTLQESKKENTVIHMNSATTENFNGEHKEGRAKDLNVDENNSNTQVKPWNFSSDKL